VLGLELFDDGPAPVLMATLYDPATGEAVDRRELPRSATRTKGWAEEVARWVTQSAAGVRPAPPPPPPLPRPAAPVLALGIDADQVARPEAHALLAELRDRLAARGRPRLGPPGAPQGGEATHRAVIAVENFGIAERPHHLHRYRSGVLTATLTVADTRTGTVIFSRRATAEMTARARHTTDQQVLTALVGEVVFRWMAELDDPAFDQLLQRSL
jgi:hypothetical protein